MSVYICVLKLQSNHPSNGSRECFVWVSGGIFDLVYMQCELQRIFILVYLLYICSGMVFYFVSLERSFELVTSLTGGFCYISIVNVVGIQRDFKYDGCSVCKIVWSNAWLKAFVAKDLRKGSIFW